MTHTWGDHRRFDIRNIRSKALYIQLLLKSGGIALPPNMRSDLPQGFYQCWLAGLQVVPGRKAAFYQKVLRGEVAAHALEEQGAIEDGLVEPPSPAPAPSRTTMMTQALQVRAPHSSPSSASPSRAPEPALAPDDAVEPGAAHEEGGWPATIDGAPCSVEARKGSYHRLRIRCQRHPSCDKSRVTTIPISASPLSGPHEAISYLAAWHKSGLVMDRDSHKLAKPTLAQQRAWLCEQGLDGAPTA